MVCGLLRSAKGFTGDMSTFARKQPSVLVSGLQVAWPPARLHNCAKQMAKSQPSPENVNAAAEKQPPYVKLSSQPLQLPDAACLCSWISNDAELAGAGFDKPGELVWLTELSSQTAQVGFEQLPCWSFKLTGLRGRKAHLYTPRACQHSDLSSSAKRETFTLSS